MINPENPEIVPDLLGDALAARALLEQAWSTETAYQGITLQPGDPPSRGQCGVSSLWYARQLVRRGVQAYFTEGLIGLDGLDEAHVWIEIGRRCMEPIVMDLTSDQYDTVNGAKVHIGLYGSGPGLIGSYQPRQRFRPDAVPRRKLLARYAILEANIAQLPGRAKRQAIARGVCVS